MISKLHVYFRSRDFLRYKNQMFYENLKKIQESQKQYNIICDYTHKKSMLQNKKG